MANEKNLIPFNQRTESERREISKKAGKASGEARRRKRDAKAAAKFLLNLQTTEGAKESMRKIGVPDDDAENATNMEYMIFGVMYKAMKGDERATRLMLELAGEDPKTKAEAERLKMEKARFKAEQDGRAGKSDAINDWLTAVMEEDTGAGDGEEE